MPRSDKRKKESISSTESTSPQSAASKPETKKSKSSPSTAPPVFARKSAPPTPGNISIRDDDKELKEAIAKKTNDTKAEKLVAKMVKQSVGTERPPTQSSSVRTPPVPTVSRKSAYGYYHGMVNQPKNSRKKYDRTCYLKTLLKNTTKLMADNPDDSENIIQNYNNAVVDWITAQIIDMIVGTVKTCSTGLDEQNHHYLRAVGLEELVVKFFANLKGLIDQLKEELGAADGDENEDTDDEED